MTLCSQFGYRQVIADPALYAIGSEENFFANVMRLQGQIFRQEKNRRTFRFVMHDNGYFAKIHVGVGWKEIIKNLCQWRMPVLSATLEWQAIAHCKQYAIPTMEAIAYGLRGWNPATLHSFIITKELTNTVSLETFCQNWGVQPPSLRLKRALIAKVAQMAKVMHASGMNHRDCYICHFLLDRTSLLSMNLDNLKLYLIDLHRAQLRPKVPQRWIIKDVAGLYFSSMGLGLTTRDCLWFIKNYSQQSLATALQDERLFWQKVVACGQNLFHKIKAREHQYGS